MKKRKKLKKKFKILFLLLIAFYIFKILAPYINVSTIMGDPNIENKTMIFDTNTNKSSDIESVVMNHRDDNLTIEERLKKLSEEDSRVSQIIENYDEYPEQLLDMLSRNREMVDYVYNFLNEKGNTYSNTIGQIDNEIPLLLQWDKRWGYGEYGENYVAMSGCGPTSLAMVIAGLTKDNSITPYKVAKFAEENGYYVPNVGTSWSLMTDGAKSFGINSRQISLSKQVIFNALEKGHPIICSMRKGDFTNNGHFIVLVGIENGTIKVNDPNSKERSSVLWPYERLEGQIKNLWEFYK